MPKYIFENCFNYIEGQSVYIEEVKIENSNLYLTFDGLEITKEHPLNPYNEECETNKVVLVFYEFEVLSSGYYECSHVQKQIRDFDKDCVYIEVPLLELLNNFTIVTEDIKAKDESIFEQSFEGFAWQFGEETWGYFELRYRRMEMMWDSFYNE